MKWKLKQVFFGMLVLIAISCEGQSSIAKRWQTVGRLLHDKIDRTDVKFQKYDFTSTGQFTIYENGDIVQSGTYVMAADKKSMLLKSGNRKQTLKIAKLTVTELHLVAESAFSGVNTVVLYPSAGNTGKKAKQGIIDYNTLLQKWDATRYHTLRFTQFLFVAIEDVKDQGNQKEYFSGCAKHERELQNVRTSSGIPEKEEFETYSALQDKINECGKAFLRFAEGRNLTIDIKKALADFQTKLADFRKAYADYSQP